LTYIKSLDQNTLLEHCIKNMEWAQKELYNQYSDELYAMCCRYAIDKEEAKDMLQEGFVRIFVNLKQFEGKGSLIGWMKKVMSSTAINYLKKNRKFISNDIDNYKEYFHQEEHITANLEAKSIMNAFMELPYHYRVVLNMYIIDGYSYKEISENLKIEESSCRTKVHRGKALLQNIIQEKEKFNTIVEYNEGAS
jgi:RNA polymerase sigma factor (sigma-70 family)